MSCHGPLPLLGLVPPLRLPHLSLVHVPRSREVLGALGRTLVGRRVQEEVLLPVVEPVEGPDALFLVGLAPRTDDMDMVLVVSVGLSVMEVDSG